MKKLAIYLLIFLVSFVYTYESIHVLTRILGDNFSYTWLESIEGSDSEEKEQKEKNEFAEQIYLNTQLNLSRTGIKIPDPCHSINFSSSDYRKTIYSPPEKIG